ncbi:hypothetical protein Pmani_017472 [Petrolisthes manimaculis]|uniref:Insertion element IS150 protein InsJ-like helix-turn-helix domain-containing protein n=1 Tax=Petrolisthes manimaculis TaxID=1843537 RepID=A0AAE1U5F3_9EUCA|nr:hypothetical protein Pmani_017472 [Petrolisthes manimaculis]
MDHNQDKIALRGRIVGMREAGHSTAEVCRELGVSHTTVDKWWRRWRAEGDLRDRPRSGAPRRTTPVEDNEIVEEASIHPITNAMAIRDNLQLQVSSDTVRRRLRERGLLHRIQQKKRS